MEVDDDDDAQFRMVPRKYKHYTNSRMKLRESQQETIPEETDRNYTEEAVNLVKRDEKKLAVSSESSEDESFNTPYSQLGKATLSAAPGTFEHPDGWKLRLNSNIRLSDLNSMDQLSLIEHDRYRFHAGSSSAAGPLLGLGHHDMVSTPPSPIFLPKYVPQQFRDPQMDDDPGMLSPTLSSASGAPKRSRSEKKPIPDNMKDSRYFERRRRNNMAAKKSRDARKCRGDHVAMRAHHLEKENAVLLAQVVTLREEANSLNQLLIQKREAKRKTL